MALRSFKSFALSRTCNMVIVLYWLRRTPLSVAIHGSYQSYSYHNMNIAKCVLSFTYHYIIEFAHEYLVHVKNNCILNVVIL